MEIIYKSVKRVTQYFCFLDRHMKGGTSWISGKGVDLEKWGGGMTLLTNYAMSHPISFSRHQQNMLLSIFLGSTSKAMADREKKEGKTKILILENEKSFLDAVKHIFHSF